MKKTLMLGARRKLDPSQSSALLNPVHAIFLALKTNYIIYWSDFGYYRQTIAQTFHMYVRVMYHN